MFQGGPVGIYEHPGKMVVSVHQLTFHHIKTHLRSYEYSHVYIVSHAHAQSQYISDTGCATTLLPPLSLRLHFTAIDQHTRSQGPRQLHGLLVFCIGLKIVNPVDIFRPSKAGEEANGSVLMPVFFVLQNTPYVRPVHVRLSSGMAVYVQGAVPQKLSRWVRPPAHGGTCRESAQAVLVHAQNY